MSHVGASGAESSLARDATLRRTADDRLKSARPRSTALAGEGREDSRGSAEIGRMAIEDGFRVAKPKVAPQGP